MKLSAVVILIAAAIIAFGLFVLLVYSLARMGSICSEAEDATYKAFLRKNSDEKCQTEED